MARYRSNSVIQMPSCCSGVSCWRWASTSSRPVSVPAWSPLANRIAASSRSGSCTNSCAGGAGAGGVAAGGGKEGLSGRRPADRGAAAEVGGGRGGGGGRCRGGGQGGLVRPTPRRPGCGGGRATKVQFPIEHQRLWRRLGLRQGYQAGRGGGEIGRTVMVLGAVGCAGMAGGGAGCTGRRAGCAGDAGR